MVKIFLSSQLRILKEVLKMKPLIIMKGFLGLGIKEEKDLDLLVNKKIIIDFRLFILLQLEEFKESFEKLSFADCLFRFFGWQNILHSMAKDLGLDAIIDMQDGTPIYAFGK